MHLPRAGTIGRIDARALGLAIVALGGGRTNPADAIDHTVGLSEVLGPGERVGADRPFAIVHARTEAGLEAAARAIEAAVSVVDEVPSMPPPVIIEAI
jgi:thymidine phosphorylase